MSNKYKKTNKDQLEFFNKNAVFEKPENGTSFYRKYTNKEVMAGFAWLGDRNRILDYGCGTGLSITQFFEQNPLGKTLFIGVDIADVAIQRVKRDYPDFTFYTIKNNKIPLLQDESVDGAYLLHVLHHSHEHEAILREIYSKLVKRGKFFLCDLSSGNPILRVFRKIFIISPDFIKQRFSDDLVVDGGIPEKYKVDLETITAKLKEIGFSVQEVGHGHLGMFVFAWLDRFVPFSRFAFFRALYSAFCTLEELLLKYRFFQKHAEVFYIKCIK